MCQRPDEKKLVRQTSSDRADKVLISHSFGRGLFLICTLDELEESKIRDGQNAHV
jgi:hypothetical protein